MGRLRMNVGWRVAAGIACLSVSLGAVAVALASKHVATNLDLEEFAPNVYAFISNNTTHAWEDRNVTVVIGDQAIAVIDAPAAYLTPQHLEQIRRFSRKPVRYLINTHFHRDHMLGDYLYKEAYPELQIVQQIHGDPEL